MSEDAAYSIFDILRTLVERVGWPTEAEKHVVLKSITRAESVGLFGNMATLITCPHDKVVNKLCTGCGRIVG